MFTELELKKKKNKLSSQRLNIQFLNMHLQLVAFKGILTSDAVFAALGMNSSFMFSYYTIYLKQVFATWFLAKEMMKQAWLVVHINENSGLAKQAAQRLEFSMSLFAGSILPW